MEGKTELVDQEYIRKYWEGHWGLPVVSMNRNYMPEDVHGLVYRDEWGEAQGLITWYIEGDVAEMVTVDAFQQGRHIGGRLLSAAEAEVRKRGVHRIRIITTNDNLRAVAFYVRHGYRLMKVDLDGMDRVRRQKPNVPEVGFENIPLRDMYELEKELNAPMPVARALPRETRPESFS
jgi:ribosomal protein S18 acetylase RimI-like enzyme